MKGERPDTGPVTGQAMGSATPPCADPAPPPEDVPPEALLIVLRGIGASMFLTEHHLIVARDEGQRRPRTGIQAFTLDAIRHMRIELGSARSGRIVVWTTGAQEALSMFFDARSLDRARELLEVARPLISRSRPGRSGTDPAVRSASSRRSSRSSRDTTRGSRG